MEKNIPGKEVTVIRDRYGVYPSGVKRFIDCRHLESFGAQQIITGGATTTSGQAVAAGTIYYDTLQIQNLGSVTLVDVIKVKNEQLGFVWLAPSQYQALLTSCNGCCNP